MRKLLTVTLLALFLATAPAAADPDMTDPPESSAGTDEIRHYDREGTSYKCLDYNTTAGCLYAVEQYENGFMLYFVSPEGDRYRRWLPNEMVAGDPYERFTRNPTHVIAGPCPSY